MFILLLMYDTERIIIPFQVLPGLLGACLFPWLVVNFLVRSNLAIKYMENDDDFHRADHYEGLRKYFDSFQRMLEKTKKDWREGGLERIGTSLELREDLYSWSFITLFHPDYLAMMVFDQMRQDKISKD